MTLFLSRGRKAFAALAAAAAIGVAVAPTSASAGGWHGHRHGHGLGYGAAGFVGGLLIGSAIASSQERVVYERRCWTERRKLVDAYGDVYVKRIRVCD